MFEINFENRHRTVIKNQRDFEKDEKRGSEGRVQNSRHRL